MFLTDKLFHLRSSALFQGLDSNELAAIANVCSARSYKTGETVFSKGNVPQKLVVPISGKLLLNDNNETKIVQVEELGISALLFNLALKESCMACDKEGFTCLQINRSNFFSIIHECPELLLNFMSTLEKGK